MVVVVIGVLRWNIWLCAPGCGYTILLGWLRRHMPMFAPVMVWWLARVRGCVLGGAYLAFTVADEGSGCTLNARRLYIERRLTASRSRLHVLLLKRISIT